MNELTVRLRGGGRLAVRPMAAADGPAVIAGFEHLSPAARRLRFLSPTPRLTPAVAADLTTVDDDHIVLLAFDAAGRVVAGARATRHRGDPGVADVADVAVTVGDHLQRRGLGRRLLLLLRDEARRAGIERLTGHVAVDNVAAQRLLIAARAIVSLDEPGVLAFDIALGRRTLTPTQAAHRPMARAS